MKIFDRYIVRSFLRNYLLSFVVLVGLYIALDMVFNFDELTRGASMQGADPDTSTFSIVSLIFNIAEFYFYQMFAFFVQLSGVIPVVAAAFTLVRMMRFNELTAMLAAGVPMVRIAIPVVLAGVVMSVLLVVDQELIIPNITHKLIRQHDDVGQARAASFRVAALEDSAGSLLMAARYNPPGFDRDGTRLPATIEELDVIEFDKQRDPVSHIQARGATYDDKGIWQLTDGYRQTGLRPTDTPATTPLGQWKSDVGPNEIALYRKSSFVDLLSTSQINNLLEHPRNYGTVPLLRVKHSRIVQPLTNVLLLLLAIPCILTREPHALRATATRTVLLTGACMALVFISFQVAGRPPTPEMTWYWPALMLWMPIFVFGPIAVWMMERLKT